jgi:HlyD family secretion protein
MRIRITRKRAIWLAVTLGTAAVVVYSMLPEPLAVESAMVAAHDLEVTVEEDGRVRMTDRYLVTAPVSGRLERIALREGATVTRGQTVAHIQPMPLDQSTRAQLQAALDAALARQRAAQGALQQASPAREQAKRDLERRRALAAQGAVADEDVEKYELALRSRDAELNSARESANAAAAEVRAARAALIGAASPSPSAAVTVRAPADGTVLRIPERSGRITAAGETILELGSAGALEVVVDVLSVDAVRIRPGMPVTLSGWGGPDLPAHVRTVEPAAFTRLSALGVEEQRVNVIIDVEDCPPELGDGYRVDAEILIWSADAVLTVPNSALFRSGEEWRTFVVEEGRAKLRTVTLGERGETRSHVIGGLSTDEEVILFPSDQLQDGTRVRTRSVSGL